MSEEKHTPGPWVAFGGDQLGRPGSIISDDSCEAVISPAFFVGDPRDDDDSTGLHVSLDVKEADLKLVLAAPELLEACKAALTIYPRIVTKRGKLATCSFEHLELVVQLRNAIAKAEGKG